MPKPETKPLEIPEDAKKKAKANKPKPEGGHAKKPAETTEDGFTHLVRVSGVVLEGNLDIRRAITRIKGVGPQIATAIVRQAGYPQKKKLGTLTEADVEKLEAIISSISQAVPNWMINRRKDPIDGGNHHLIGPEVEIAVREDIARLKRIRSWKGFRHATGQPVRGQRTRSTFRKGGAIGVVRKKEQPASTGSGSTEKK
ncbi:30S ribosomal protein S13 [uncultured archaeon]|nr:30S ribosomal protein S13 [uncultured archaeon]